MVVIRKSLLLVAAAASVLASMSATAQTSGGRSVEQYACRDLIRESGASRDVAIAFLHGYLLGKSSQSTFDVDMLHKQSEAFVERCIDNPNERAIDAMLAVKQSKSP